MKIAKQDLKDALTSPLWYCEELDVHMTARKDKLSISGCCKQTNAIISVTFSEDRMPKTVVKKADD